MNTDEAWEAIEKAAMASVKKSAEPISKSQAVAAYLETPAGRQAYAEYSGARVVQYARDQLAGGNLLLGAADLVRKSGTVEKAAAEKESLRKGKRIIKQIEKEIEREDLVAQIRKEERRRAMAKARAELKAEALSQGYDLHWVRR